MRIGGGKFLEFSLETGEKVILKSQYDVEEVSKYRQSLNPWNLFLAGSTFYLGYLFLTDHRLILLPYSQAVVKKVKRLEKLAYWGLAKIGLGGPQPEIGFSPEPLLISLGRIRAVDPYGKQFRIHPILAVFAEGETFRFKFVPRESPLEWAERIRSLCGCEIRRG
jgi:hypothetical protein